MNRYFGIVILLLMGLAPVFADGGHEVHVPDMAEIISRKVDSITSPTESAHIPVAPLQTDFSLTIEPAENAASTTSATFLAVLAQIKTPMSHHVGEATLWWTSPLGERSNVPLRMVDGNHWASLANMVPDPGHHRLILLIMVESASSDIDRMIEQTYDFELPGMQLALRSQRELEEKAPEINDPLPAARMDAIAMAGDKKIETKVPITVSSVALPFIYVNVFIAMVLITTIVAARHMPRPIRAVISRQLEKLPGLGNGSQRIQEVLEEAGLMDPMPASGKPAGGGKIIQTATIDESKLERAVIEDEKPVVRTVQPKVLDAGKKTELLIKRLKEEVPSEIASPADSGESGPNAAEPQLAETKKKTDESGSPLDLNDLSF